MDKILVIVDFQKDFYDSKNGSLYVNGAEKCVKPICEEIESGEYSKVILTVDWHGLDDKSFEKNGGQWPVHCIQFSEGSSIHPKIMKTLQETGIKYQVFIKGNCYNHEEYGAFEKYSGFNSSCMLKNNLGDSVVLINNIKSVKFVCCGIAGNYCVYQTYKNLCDWFGSNNIELFEKGTAFIGDKFDYSQKYQTEIGTKS